MNKYRIREEYGSKFYIEGAAPNWVDCCEHGNPATIHNKPKQYTGLVVARRAIETFINNEEESLKRREFKPIYHEPNKD